MEANGNASRFSEKMQDLTRRLHTVRSELYRAESMLHGGPPPTDKNPAPVASDLHSLVHEQHYVIEEIELSVKRVLISLGADDPNVGKTPQPMMVGAGSGQSETRANSAARW